MGMPTRPRDVPPLPPGERWTADRVRHELIDETRASPRYEFIDGEVLVTPSPAPIHQIALRELFRLVDAYVSAQELGETLWSPSDVEVAPDTTAQPDLFVVPREEFRRVRRLRGQVPIHALLLAVEVLSPSSVRNDRLTKRRHYVGRGVEYWVVDLDARAIERNAPGDPRVDVHDDRLVWHPPGAAAPLALDVADYFHRVLGGDDDPGAE